MRKPIIAGNWKMNKTPSEAAVLAAELKAALSGFKSDVVVCPPMLSIAAVKDALAESGIGIGAQNVHWAASGAYTGEVSAAMLREMGVEYVIIGHSERRQCFGETDATVNRRVKAAIGAGLTPIVCIGELLAEREAGYTFPIIEYQTRMAFAGIDEADMARSVIAYEPVWAIGTGVTATDEQAEEALCRLRQAIAAAWNPAVAEAMRLQYGGSMNAANADGLMSQKNIDGGLIGGASLKAADFAAIIKASDAHKA